ncbi:MAG: autotransporter domain-containing protein [Candidatus Thiodiazotropha sp.]|nr:autotransporter domain-containing protein [Candidatus Thiodiazotropha sp.]MCM8885447.1 autotransporter domain-containing protein [Candidatus Thiodiazotropha sp.]
MNKREQYMPHPSADIVLCIDRKKNIIAVEQTKTCLRRNWSYRLFAFATSLLLLIPFAAHALILDITPASETVNEGDGIIPGAVRLTREASDSPDACTVAGFISLGGTATFNADYDLGGETLDFQVDLLANAQFAEDPGGINILDDAIQELDETINITINDATISTADCGGLVINNVANTIITIQDNDTTALNAVDDAASTSANIPVTINVLANDTGTGIGVSSLGIASNGTVVDNGDETLTYTPNTDFAGVDSFTYTITDLLSVPDTATVTVTVTAAAPVTNAADDTATTDIDHAVSIDVLANDTGSGISVSSVGSPTNGTAVNNGNGTITYIPNTVFEGTDSFTYTIIDAIGATDTATVTVSVGGTNFGDLLSLTKNQQSVADGLDALCSTTQSGELQAQCNTIASLSADLQALAFSEIAPNDLAAQGSGSVEIATTQITNIRMRLAALRNGTTGLAMSDLSLGVRGQSIPMGTLTDAVINERRGGGASADETGRFGVFVNGRINFGDKDATANESGFDFDTQGITIGVDYRLNDRLILGGALGFASTDSDFDNSGGELDNEARTVSFYGNFNPSERTYVDWIATVGQHDFEAVRNLLMLSTRTEGDTDGDEIALSLSGGTNFSRGSLLLDAYGRLEYIEVDIDGYQESGGGGLALLFEDQTVESLTTALGARLSNAYSMSWGVLTPSVYLEWEHEFEDDERLITAAFAEDPTASFSVVTDRADEDYFNYGFGLAAMLPRGKSFFLNYESVTGRDGIDNTTIDLGLRFEF